MNTNTKNKIKSIWFVTNMISLIVFILSIHFLNRQGVDLKFGFAFVMLLFGSKMVFEYLSNIEITAGYGIEVKMDNKVARFSALIVALGLIAAGTYWIIKYSY